MQRSQNFRRNFRNIEVELNYDCYGFWLLVKHGYLQVRVRFFGPSQNHGGRTGWTGQTYTVERGWSKGVKMRENNISEVNDKKGDIETG